jgi:hypothetical protein
MLAFWATLVVGWRWSPQPCDPSDPDLEITLPAMPSADHFRRAAAVFKRCGVVALHDALPLASVAGFRAAVERDLAPLVASRARVVDALTHAARNRMSLRALWSDEASPLREEVLFASGRHYRERNAGRIDLQLPFEGAYADAAFSANANVLGVLRALLGDELKLKSLHAVAALTQADGIEEQHWHRDTQQLFIDDEQRAMDPRSARSVAGGDRADGGGAAGAGGAGAPRFDEDVHRRFGGVHLPPYGVNVFAALRSVRKLDGPTEFTLGSHMWGTRWSEEACFKRQDCTLRSFELAPGSVVVADYRTVHRGMLNASPSPRLLAMLVYGRPWWSDSVNYYKGRGDYGGFEEERALWSDATAAARVAGVTTEVAAPLGAEGAAARRRAERTRMYWGLVARLQRLVEMRVRAGVGGREL